MAGCCQCSPMCQVGAAVFQMGLCLLLSVTGYAAPNWVDREDVDVHYGLWTFCEDGDCVSLPDPLETTDIEVARAFGIIGLLATAGSIGLGVVFVLQRNNSMLLFAGIMCIVAFVTILIEFIVIVVEIDTGDYGFCFGLTIAGFSQAFFAALNFFYAKCSFDKCEPM